jgi:hypothetical protein
MNRLILSIIVFFLFTNISAGQIFKPDLSEIKNTKIWKISNRDIKVSGTAEQTIVSFDARQGDGIAVYQNLDFENGTIELDIKGKNVFQQSFVGVAFHVQDEKTFNAVYFRPFNFRSDDPVRKNHAVQYICHPLYTWQKLRSDFPEKYENPVSPVPDPDQFFHAKIVIQAPDVKVYVNRSETPCLEVQLLSQYTSGKIGIWVGYGADGDFKNLIIKK